MYNKFDSKPEVIEYNDLRNELLEFLEQQYNYNMLIGEKSAAHENVKTMMEYCLIDRNDPRTSVKTKLFSPDVKVNDPSVWGIRDYRRADSSGYIASYLYATLAHHKSFIVPVIEHWGKRVEGNYEGDIKVKATFMQLRMTEAFTEIQAERTLEDIRLLLKEQGFTLPQYEELAYLAKKGIVRLYRVDANANVLNKYRKMAYVLIKMNANGNLESKMVINYESLYSTWIDIEAFITSFTEAIKNSLSVDTVVSSRSRRINSKEHD